MGSRESFRTLYGERILSVNGNKVVKIPCSFPFVIENSIRPFGRLGSSLSVALIVTIMSLASWYSVIWIQSCGIIRTGGESFSSRILTLFERIYVK